jgi:putative FmdB family regulatory protein
MPTYEYLCSSCSNQWEEVQKISEPALEVCPKCGKHTAKRQISAGNFILKGGGWYADAYSSAKPAKGGKDESSAPAAADKTETKGEKSETKAEKSEAPAAKKETPSAVPPASTKS